MRYAAEFRRAWQGASGQAIDAGKKLLGYLANQKRLSGVDSLVKRITLEDGTVVEARWDMNIPTVRIYPGGSEDAACELYVESGLLDLGPNIAGDASERFNRGLPEFDDSPATLYFGTGVDCTDNLNGSVRITARQITSDCLPSVGSSVASRLTSPTKKQAQALIPASTFSGLMQRYVQAVYGGVALDYSASTDAVVIAGVTIPAAASIGLVAVGGLLRFVILDTDTGTIEVRACAPRDECYAAVIGMWRSMTEADEEDKARKAKVLTIALSGCKVGDVVGTIALGISGNKYFARRPAMHFAPDGKTGAVVLESGKVARAYRVDFTRTVEGELAASTTLLSSGQVINASPDVWGLQVADDPSPFGSGGVNRSGFEGDEDIALGASYDFPVYALFVGTDLRLVRYTLIVSTNVANDRDSCDSTDESAPLSAQLGGAPCSTNIASFPLIVSGYFCTGSGGAAWSSVEQSRILNISEPGSGTSERYIKCDVWSKALSVVAIGEEYEVVDDLEPWSYYPSTLHAIFANDFNPSHDFDCLLAGGLDTVYNGIRTWTNDGCGITPSYTRLDCVGPSSGTGFPGMYAEANCDFRYTTKNTHTSSCTNYALEQATQTTALYVAGELYAPAPHVISMCAGSYEFVVDRYSLSRMDGVYVDRQEGFTTLVDFHFVAEFSASIWRITPESPSTSLCTPMPHITETFEGNFFGVYRTDYGNRREYYQVDFGRNISTADINDADHRQRGTEKYTSCSSFGVTYTKNGEVTFNLDTEAEDDFVAVGSEEMIDACPYVERLFIESLEHDPIKTITASSNGEEKEWGSDAHRAIDSCVLAGFTYCSATSLLGAKVLPTLQLERGASIHMDRQTITGGYPTVSTPSFVGWA